MRIEQFMHDDAYRRRFWAGARIGALRIEGIEPNDGHLALAALEREGRVNGVITQNVDGLHSVAGSKRVVELHGALRDVLCLGCGERESRAELQTRMAELNPTWHAAAGARPDGAATGNGRSGAIGNAGDARA